MIIENTYEFIHTGYPTQKLDKEALKQRLNKLKEDCAEEIDEFIEALDKDDKNEMIDACCDLLTFATNMPIHAGISVEELVNYGQAVHRSNMTKFCKTKQEAESTQTLYASGTHPNKFGEVVASEVKETGNPEWPYMVVTPGGGKILKSLNFRDTPEFL